MGGMDEVNPMDGVRSDGWIDQLHKINKTGWTTRWNGMNRAKQPRDPYDHSTSVDPIARMCSGTGVFRDASRADFMGSVSRVHLRPTGLGTVHKHPRQPAKQQIRTREREVRERV